MTKKKEEIPYQPVKWGFEECPDAVPPQTKNELPPEEFEGFHSKQTISSQGVRIEWNAPSDGWGEFL